MLSALSRGYSTWNGEVDVYGETTGKQSLPEVGSGLSDLFGDRHKHGITVTPRTPGRGALYPPHSASKTKDDGCMELPKTFLTRKGALLLFAAPDAPPEKDHVQPKRAVKRVQRRQKQQDLIDLSLKLGTLERLSLSVLQYGDQGFDRENGSVSDKENRWFLKFMHQLQPADPIAEEGTGSDPFTDHHAQPGADLKFYLQDLKQRASSRCYGRESSLSSRARSQELRDILQQLEDAWPSGHPQPLSHAPTSMSDGSYHGNEEFFYPRSPSISSESSRTFSGRAKVLSSHKLTASLKSLNYLGRPSSTEPGEQTQNVTSHDQFMPPAHISRGRRSKSGYWNGTADIPELRKRPATSHHGARSSSIERPLLTSPEVPLEEGQEPIIEEVQSTNYTQKSSPGDIPQLTGCQTSISFMNDAGQADLSLKEGGEGRSSTGSQGFNIQVTPPLVSSFPTDTGDHAPMTRVDEEHEGDRASVSSSVQQEDDILLPSDGEEGGWPEDVQEQMAGDGSDEFLARPLQPQYSGVLQDDSEMLQDFDENGKLHMPEQGSRPGSRASTRPGSRVGSRPASVIATRDMFRPASVMSSRAASRAGMLPEEEVDQEGLDELMAEGDDGFQDMSQQSMEAYLLDHAARQLEKQAQYATSFSGSGDRPERDPETLVSMQGPGTIKSSSSIKSGSEGQMELLRASATPEPKADDASVVESEPKIASKAPTPEPPTVSAMPPPETVVVPHAETETIATTEKTPAEVPVPTVVEEPAKDTLPVKAEGEEDSKSVASANSADIQAMALAEAGLQPVLSGLPSSRAASPAPSSSVSVLASSIALPGVAQEPAETPAQPSPKAATPAPVKPVTEDVKKVDVKPPQPPQAKKQPTPRAPAKGDKPEAGTKKFVKAMDISSVKTDSAEAASAGVTSPKGKESPKKEKVKKEAYRPPPPPPRVKTPAEKTNLLIPEHMKEAMKRGSTAVAQNELENELMKMHKAMDESLGVSTLITEDCEGLTEEELQKAQQALKPSCEKIPKKERMEEAQKRMQEAILPGAEKAEKAKGKPPQPPAKEGKAKKTKKTRIVDPKAAEEKLAAEAAKEERRLERQKRLEEAKALQDMISQKETERKIKEEETARKAQEHQERMEEMLADEEAIMQAEEDAREQLAALRKTQREERDARRKADLEKKKEIAQARRDKERQMMEEARKKEQEMLDRIADAEMRRTMREEEERKRDEEERLAQERFEEEMQEAQLQAEEEERRLQELEKQAEEEAFQRIVNEREDAEKQRIELEYQARKMAEEEERQRQAMLEEERRLEQECLRREAEELKRVEEERQRLKELQRMEEEAREKMRAEIDQRREWALKRREVNLDRRKNFDGLRQSQGITEPWNFSYYVHWPRETYQRPMGVVPDAKGKKKPPAKKK